MKKKISLLLCAGLLLSMLTGLLGRKAGFFMVHEQVYR